MRRPRRLFSFAVALLVMAACSEDPPKGVLQPADVQKPEGYEAGFDPNLLVESAIFTDSETLSVESVQRFLAKTPYERPSFLETYQSNGVRAADAIIGVARRYKINPLVFLVYAQITQGLIGERTYPFPPERIEYVFNCGCLQPKNCLPALAGFDRQLDCLGRSLRAALDEIAANGITTSGWGPETTSKTLDNVDITPVNDATAALYDRTPRVDEGKQGGTWIFWNVWNSYSFKIDYGGPSGIRGDRWIGEACTATPECGGVENGICADNYPGGLCTTACTGACPADPTQREVFCAKFPDGGFCLPVCDPAAPECRDGYKCVETPGVGTEEAAHVCSPLTE